MPIALVILFIVVPIVELAVIVQVGQLIGVWLTIALLVVDSILGSLLMRSQGRAAWRRFVTAVEGARVPAREVADGVLVIFGGALLLTPGFLTDILGLLFLLPPTRALIRRVFLREAMRRITVSMAGVGGMPRPRRGAPTWSTGPRVDVDPVPRRRAAAGLVTEGLGFAFADARAERYGVARAGPAGARVLLFAGRAPPWRRARTPRSACGARRRLARALRRRGRRGFALDFSPLADAVERPGAAGDDQPCRVTGTVRADGRELAVKALGQRSRTASEPDWDRVALARSVSVWTEPAAAALSATRPAAARHHAEEATSGALWERGVVVPIEEARLSTTYDAAGRTRRAGLELWPAGDERCRLGPPRRRRAAVRGLARARRAAHGLRVHALAHRGPAPASGATRSCAPRRSPERGTPQPRQPPAQQSPAPAGAQFSDPSRSQQ